MPVESSLQGYCLFCHPLLGPPQLSLPEQVLELLLVVWIKSSNNYIAHTNHVYCI